MSAEPHWRGGWPRRTAKVRSPIGGDIRFVLRGEQTNGALAALDALVPPGGGSPLHAHRAEDECVYVLEVISASSSATS